MLTTQFFAMKIQRYMAEHGISESTLAKVASKAFGNGALNPNAWRRRPLSEEEVLASQDGQPPADAVHVLLAGRGRGRARAGARRARPGARAHARATCARWRSARGASARSRCSARRSRSTTAPSPTTEAAAAAFEQAGIGPDDVDVAQLQDTESGAEIMHLAETGFCEHGEQEHADPERRDADRRPAAGQHRRRLPGQRRADRRLRPAPGPRGRAAAARRGRRPPGRRAGPRRLHAGLRRARASARARCSVAERGPRGAARRVPRRRVASE